MSRSFSHAPIDFRSMPPAIKWLIVANTAVFLLRTFVGREFDLHFGLVPARVLEDRWVWQPLTYLFLHGGIFHLLFNLFAIWMFGMPVEAQWGSREFFKYYLLCGLGAAVAVVALSPDSAVPVIGASGPVYGLLVAFAMLYPDAVVYLYFLIPLTARQMAILFGFIEFFAGVSDSTPGVARFAHLGGMVVGYIYIRWWWIWKIRARAVVEGFSERPLPRVGRKVARPAAREREPAAELGMDDVDRILDKISASGLESLTAEERSIMKRYSERHKS